MIALELDAAIQVARWPFGLRGGQAPWGHGARSLITPRQAAPSPSPAQRPSTRLAHRRSQRTSHRFDHRGKVSARRGSNMHALPPRVAVVPAGTCAGATVANAGDLRRHKPFQCVRSAPAQARARWHRSHQRPARKRPRPHSRGRFASPLLTLPQPAAGGEPRARRATPPPPRPDRR